MLALACQYFNFSLWRLHLPCLWTQAAVSYRRNRINLPRNLLYLHMGQWCWHCVSYSICLALHEQYWGWLFSCSRMVFLCLPSHMNTFKPMPCTEHMWQHCVFPHIGLNLYLDFTGLFLKPVSNYIKITYFNTGYIWPLCNQYVSSTLSFWQLYTADCQFA